MSDGKGSKSSSNYAVTRFNAVRHGVLSKHTVLPWEDEAEYESLLRALVEEHKPSGPTEEHLVEELAGAMWRKRRLRVGEKAAHSRALKHTTEQGTFSATSKAALVLVTNDYGGRATGEAVSATAEQDAAALNALSADESRITAALKILEKCDSPSQNIQRKAYEEALTALNKFEHEMWGDQLRETADRHGFLKPGEVRYYETPASLEDFIKALLLPRYRDRRLELENRDLVREQSFGEAVNIPELDGFARYEIHLDRKFERTLTMLVKLQNLRRPPPIDAG